MAVIPEAWLPFTVAGPLAAVFGIIGVANPGRSRVVTMIHAWTAASGLFSDSAAALS